MAGIFDFFKKKAESDIHAYSDNESGSSVDPEFKQCCSEHVDTSNTTRKKERPKSARKSPTSFKTFGTDLDEVVAPNDDKFHLCRNKQNGCSVDQGFGHCCQHQITSIKVKKRKSPLEDIQDSGSGRAENVGLIAGQRSAKARRFYERTDAQDGTSVDIGYVHEDPTREFDVDAGIETFQVDKLHAHNYMLDGTSVDSGYGRNNILEDTTKVKSNETEESGTSTDGDFDVDAGIETFKVDKLHARRKAQGGTSVDQGYGQNFICEDSTKEMENESPLDVQYPGTNTARDFYVDVDIATFQDDKLLGYRNIQKDTSIDPGIGQSCVQDDTTKVKESEGPSSDIQDSGASSVRDVAVDAGEETFFLDMLTEYRDTQDDAVDSGQGQSYIDGDISKVKEIINTFSDMEKSDASTYRNFDVESDIESLKVDKLHAYRDILDSPSVDTGHVQSYIHEETPKVMKNGSPSSNIQEERDTSTARDVDVGAGIETSTLDVLTECSDTQDDFSVDSGQRQKYVHEDTTKVKRIINVSSDMQESDTSTSGDFDVDAGIKKVDKLHLYKNIQNDKSIDLGHGLSNVQEDSTKAREKESPCSNMQDPGTNTPKDFDVDAGIESFILDVLSVSRDTLDGTSVDSGQRQSFFHKDTTKVKKNVSSGMQESDTSTSRDFDVDAGIATFQVDNLNVYRHIQNDKSIDPGHGQSSVQEDTTNARETESPFSEMQDPGTSTSRDFDVDAGIESFILDVLNASRDTQDGTSVDSGQRQSSVHEDTPNVKEIVRASYDMQESGPSTSSDFDVDTGIDTFIIDMLNECRDTHDGTAVDSRQGQTHVNKDTTNVKVIGSPSSDMKESGTSTAKEFDVDAGIDTFQVDKLHSYRNTQGVTLLNSIDRQSYVHEVKENESPSSDMQKPGTSTAEDFDVDAGIGTYILDMLHECKNTLIGTTVDPGHGQTHFNEEKTESKKVEIPSSDMEEQKTHRVQSFDVEADVETFQRDKSDAHRNTQDDSSIDSGYGLNYDTTNINEIASPSSDKHDPGTSTVRDVDVEAGIETFILDILNQCKNTLISTINPEHGKSSVSENTSRVEETERSSADMQEPGTSTTSGFDVDAGIDTFILDMLNECKNTVNDTYVDPGHRQKYIHEDTAKQKAIESSPSGRQEPGTHTAQSVDVDAGIESFKVGRFHVCRNTQSGCSVDPGSGQSCGHVDKPTKQETENGAYKSTPNPNDRSMQGACSLSGNLKDSSFRKSTTTGNKKQSVRFNDEVCVETFTDVELELNEPTSQTLSFGDGPSSGPEIPSTSTGYRPSMPDGKPVEKPPLRKKDSVGTNLSPTDILRKKQKQVADKILKSVSEKPTSSGEFRKTKVVSHKLDYEDIPSKKGAVKDKDETRVKNSKNSRAVSEFPQSKQINDCQVNVPGALGVTDKSMKSMSEMPTDSDKFRKTKVVSHKLNNKFNPSKQEEGEDKEENRVENLNNILPGSDLSHAKKINECKEQVQGTSDATENILSSTSEKLTSLDEFKKTNVFSHKLNCKDIPPKQQDEKDKEERRVAKSNNPKIVSEMSHSKQINECQQNLPEVFCIMDEMKKSTSEKPTGEDELKNTKVVNHKVDYNTIQPTMKSNEESKTKTSNETRTVSELPHTKQANECQVSVQGSPCVTNTIMKSMSEKPTGSGEIRNTKAVSNKLDHKDIPSKQEAVKDKEERKVKHSNITGPVQEFSHTKQVKECQPNAPIVPGVRDKIATIASEKPTDYDKFRQTHMVSHKADYKDISSRQETSKAKEESRVMNSTDTRTVPEIPKQENKYKQNLPETPDVTDKIMSFFEKPTGYDEFRNTKIVHHNIDYKDISLKPKTIRGKEESRVENSKNTRTVPECSYTKQVNECQPNAPRVPGVTDKNMMSVSEKPNDSDKFNQRHMVSHKQNKDIHLKDEAGKDKEEIRVENSNDTIQKIEYPHITQVAECQPNVPETSGITDKLSYTQCSVSEKLTNSGEFRNTNVISNVLNYKYIASKQETVKGIEESRMEKANDDRKVSEFSNTEQIHECQPNVPRVPGIPDKIMKSVSEKPTDADKFSQTNEASCKLNNTYHKQNAGKDNEKKNVEKSNDTRTISEFPHTKQVTECQPNVIDTYYTNEYIFKGVCENPTGSDTLTSTHVVNHELNFKEIPSKQEAEKDNEESRGETSNNTRPVSEFTHSKPVNECQPNVSGSPGPSRTRKHKKLSERQNSRQTVFARMYSMSEDTDDSLDAQASEPGVPDQSVTRKHKKLSERQNSRQAVLARRYSINEETDDSFDSQTSVNIADSRKHGEKEDTPLPIQDMNKMQKEEKQSTSESIGFTSQAQFKRKEDDMEKNIDNFPGFGSLNYTTPSMLLRKCTDRQRNEENGPGYGTFSYTTPSELLLKTENANKITQKDNTTDGYKSSNEVVSATVDQGASGAGGADTDTSKTDKQFIGLEEQNGEPEMWFFKPLDYYQDRKYSQNDQRSVENNEALQEGNSYTAVPKEGFDPSKRHEEDLKSQNEVYLEDSCGRNNATDDEFFETELNDIPAVLDNMNSMVSQFLNMLNIKRQNGLPITTDDYRELSLIESAIETIINKLTASFACVESHYIPFDTVKDQQKVVLVQNLRSHLSLLTAAKDVIKNSLQSRRSPVSKGREQTISQPENTLNEAKENEQRQPSMDEVFWAIDGRQKTHPAKTDNILSTGRSLSGYLGDISTESLNERKPSTNGFSFSNDFIDEQTLTAGSRDDSGMYGSEIAPPSSIILDDDLWSVTSVHGSELDNAACRHSSKCDCFECKKQWFYWNKRLEKDADAFEEEGQDSERLEFSRKAFMKTRLQGTPYPSRLTVTTNPSFAVSDDEDDADDEDETKGIAGSTSPHHTDVDSQGVSDPSAASEGTVAQGSPQRQINMITRLTFPGDTSTVRVELGPSRFMLTTEEGLVQQSLDYDMQQTCDDDADTISQRGESGLAKRKQAGRSLTPDSRLMMDKEVVETQNRKLQTEISTLQTENKLLKEKYNRSQARISELEDQLCVAQEDVADLQESLNREVSGLRSRTQTEIDRGRDDLQARVITLTKQNEALKSEIASLEKQVDGSNRTIDMVRHNTEKTRTLEAHKSEITALKEELGRVKALLDQSERHLREEEERHTGVAAQVVRLTELKNALQQQQGADSTGTVGDKQLKSLEKRLHVTEERLHQERADRANNLSTVEDKLLTENARLQAAEKDLTRQLHREKEKNRNLDHRVKTVRDENEKLRLAIPFDDAKLLEDKQNYDIPYSSHSNQRAETMKHISDDMNYILSQIEKQDGLTAGSSGQEEVIRTLWNKRERAYQQLREFELNFEELHLNDNNILDGLKNLRDTYGQAESKLKGMEEQVTDAQSQMVTFETTYKEQLNMLVHERHDALARLKTAEDILEATRAENELLRQNVHVVQAGEGGRLNNGVSGSSEGLTMEIANLESKLAQVTRTNQKLDGELGTTRAQVDARNKALQDVQSELDLAYSRLKGTDCDDRMQNKIDKLSTEVSGLQVELKMTTDKYNSTLAEKSRLESELTELRKQADTQRARQQKSGQAESKVQQQLKDEISEKEGRLTTVTKQLEETEKELNKHQQDLYIEQMHNSELEAEVEALRVTVEQRAQMFESVSGTERDQLAQYTLLKDTLDNLNQELAQKHAQIISLDVNLSSQKDRTAELEAEIERLRANRDPEEESSFTLEEQSSAHQLRIGELEKERSQIKQELVQAYNAIKAAEEQYRTLQSESAQLEQELVKEKTVILQITAEKGEVEQHLEELAEEHDSLIQEKNQAEEDLIRLETKLQEILQKYETEARKNHTDFTRDYPNLPPEARKLVSELDSLRLLVDGKDREIAMLQDKINRQQIDIEFLNRKVELVHNDSISNREDVARMIQELTLKMKEAVSTREVNQFLVGERTKLQNEKLHLETELERERQVSDKQKHEIADVVRKVQGTESRQKTAEKESQAQASLISTLQCDLHAARESYSAVECEMTRLKAKLDAQSEELRSVTGVRGTVEEQLVAEKNMLSEERNALSKLREEFNRLSHDHELLQHEHSVLCDKHEADVQSLENLRSDLAASQSQASSLQEELHGTRLDLEGQKGQLTITKDTVQKLNQDKGTIYQDYEGMCRTVTEKERQLSELRHQSEEKMDHLQQLHHQEKSHLEQHKSSAEHERDALKRDMDSLREQIDMKEIQLNTFGKTLQELEETKRKKNQLEAQLHKLESSSGDSRLLLEGQRKELMALNEALAKQQDRSNRIEAENHTLKVDLKSQKQELNRECHELSLTLKELKSQHENERTYLNDNLAQTQTQLRSVEGSLVTACGERDTLHAQRRMAEAQLDQTQTQLSDEATARRLAEQSIGHLRLQLEDMRTEKSTAEAHYTEMKSQLGKVEDQLKSEHVKQQKMSGRIQELQAISHTTDTANKAKSEQMETLLTETSRLRQMMESQKQNLTGKMKKASLEFKQQLDRVQEDNDKLVAQVQKISTDLEACREQLATKNKHNLKLQEENLVLEDSVRESKTRQKKAEDTLKSETEKLSSMASRFLEQDEELKRLRNFLAKKAEDSGEADKSMWQEMNRVIQDLSRQMHEHLDAQKSEGQDGPPHHKVLLRYKKQLAEIQGELGTEKSLHQITRTSLAALEEDCQRLRHQLHAIRRREPQATQKKYKNRMEAINAIIARSQSQAQALLASGGYLDPAVNSPRAPVSARPGYEGPESPDNSYSDDLSIASLPPLHYGSLLQK